MPLLRLFIITFSIPYIQSIFSNACIYIYQNSRACGLYSSFINVLHENSNANVDTPKSNTCSWVCPAVNFALVIM